MTTAIIGVGNIGSVLAANLVRGGEDVVLASRSLERALHTLGHAHSRIVHDGAYIDPAGFPLVADIWDLPEEWEQQKEDA